MGDLGPAKPGCSLVPHKAENSNIEGEGMEQNNVLDIHRIYTASSRTPKLVNCSRCGYLDSRVCTELSAWGCSSCTAARGMSAPFLIGSQFGELYASSSLSSTIML